MKFEPKCLATGIGSVPHTDPDSAVQFILKYLPEAPYWPQLPKRGSGEGFLNQFITPLVDLGLVVQQGEKYYFDTQQHEWAERLARFYELYLAVLEGDQQALDFFRFTEESASGFYALLRHLEAHGTGDAKYIKGQISGPLTVGLAMTDQDRRAIYYNPQGRDILIKTLALQGLNQAKALGRFGLPVMVFVDDPGLYASGQSTFITLKSEEITAELNSIYEAIHSAGALAGTHSCAGLDWSILFDSQADIISFDAYEYFVSISSYMDGMRKFLGRGGVLAWGIIPTAAGTLESLTTDTLVEKLDQEFAKLEQKGISRQTILQQAMITPSCGTGTLPFELAEKVHVLTAEFARQIKARFTNER